MRSDALVGPAVALLPGHQRLATGRHIGRAEDTVRHGSITICFLGLLSFVPWLSFGQEAPACPGARMCAPFLMTAAAGIVLGRDCTSSQTPGDVLGREGPAVCR